MNASNTGNSGSALGGGMKMLVNIVILVLVIVGLYYLYNWLYGSSPFQGSVQILSGNPSMSKATAEPTSGKQAVAATELSGVLDGGEYSASFWMYVSDTKGFGQAGGAKLAHLMEISNDRFNTTASNRGKTLVFVGLNPMNGSLVVRQSTSDPSETIDNRLTSETSASVYSLDTLISGYTSQSTFASDDRCDIINGIEYQRWVLVTVVANGRTLDVYVDGKLARSCVYKGGFALGSTTGKGMAYFGLENGGNLKGFFADGRFYNYALTPAAVWGIYQAGPTGSASFLDFFKNLFSVNVSFNTSSGLNA